MLILAMALAGPAPARAAWLYCAARGATADGPVAVLTSLADIGPVTPPQLALLQTRLTAYVTAAEPGIGALQTKCAAPEDEVDAAAFSSRLLNNEARRVGWEHVVVLQPDDWLPASVGGGGILQP
jgi:hypothetical protein